MTPVLTSVTGNNAELLKHVFDLYVKENAVIADVTYGKGVFWKNIDSTQYKTYFTDLQNGVDFRHLPYDNSCLDVLILDPPYMHGGATIKPSINECYKNQNTNHYSVIRLYTGGILEAARCLKKNGKLFIKTQDETESGKQKFSHIELIQILEMLGFEVIDLFVLTQNSIPTMREQYQKTARKNHSYMLIARFRG